MLGLIAACGVIGGTILWIIAAMFVLWGIITLLRRAVLFGIILIIVGLVVGPGGFSLFC